jgi:hypothetical protein
MLMIIFLLLSSTNIILSQTIPCNKATRGMTEEEKAIVVNAHNVYRNQMATQTNTLGPLFPFATNMQQMYWNDAIAAKAQEWANACIYGHSSQTFRKQPEYDTGENIFTTWSTVDYPKLNFQYYTDVWFKEIALTTPDITDSYVFNSATGHFTQIIWATTNQIGCGFSQLRDADTGRYRNIIVCEYGPVGNILTRPIYAKSSVQECKCPTNYSCGNVTLKGLCCQTGLCGSLYSTVPATNTPVSGGSTTSTSSSTTVVATKRLGEVTVSADSETTGGNGSRFYSFGSISLVLIVLSLF